jgi:hypothetical protein
VCSFRNPCFISATVGARRTYSLCQDRNRDVLDSPGFLDLPILIAAILGSLTAIVSRTRLRKVYQHRFTESRRERLFLASLGFFTTVLVVRTITIAIHHDIGPFHNIAMNGLWLNLRDVYWEREGRESFEALALFGGLLALGVFGRMLWRGIAGN